MTVDLELPFRTRLRRRTLPRAMREAPRLDPKRPRGWIVARHALRPVAYKDTALWSYGDFVFTPGYDIMSDTLKLRQAGFDRCVDTEKMFIELFERLRAARVLP